MFMRGIGDGISGYNAAMSATDEDRRVYCPPPNVGIVDAQYVAIMSTFLAKYPNTRSQPVSLVLLFALKETFPCEKR